MWYFAEFLVYLPLKHYKYINITTMRKTIFELWMLILPVILVLGIVYRQGGLLHNDN